MTPTDPGMAELVKLAGSGSAPLLAAWAVYRIGRLETRVASIADHLGAIDCAKHHRRPIVPMAILALGVWLLCFLTGCLTPQQQEWTCDKAKAAMAAYQAAEDAGMVTDPKVVAGARLGAAFLASYCGWQTTTPKGTAIRTPSVDRNGVLIVRPP
jgi:hypothetical protein